MAAVTLLLTVILMKMNIVKSDSDYIDPALYQDEICSYNYVKIPYNNITKNVICNCRNEYANDKANPRNISGIPVQCGYEKKRRFIAFFFAVFLPIGIDYLYLGWYWAFILILMFCSTTIFGNCYRFVVFTEKNYFKNNWNFFFFVLIFIALIWWIINIALIVTGIITDSNYIETVSDIHHLYQIR